MDVRLFHITSERNHEGVVYGYRKTDGVFCSVEIKGIMQAAQTAWVITNIHLTIELFLAWASAQKGMTVVELQLEITFDTFWNKYNDKMRSSKKRSERLWNKLSKPDQVKAFYYYDTYNRNRGQAEKKYCETYLGAEMWNN